MVFGNTSLKRMANSLKFHVGGIDGQMGRPPRHSPTVEPCHAVAGPSQMAVPWAGPSGLMAIYVHRAGWMFEVLNKCHTNFLIRFGKCQEMVRYRYVGVLFGALPIVLC